MPCLACARPAPGLDDGLSDGPWMASRRRVDPSTQPVASLLVDLLVGEMPNLVHDRREQKRIWRQVFDRLRELARRRGPGWAPAR